VICYRLDVQRIEGRGYDFVELEGLGLRFIRVLFISLFIYSHPTKGRGLLCGVKGTGGR